MPVNLKERKAALSELSDLFTKNSLIIHYSCESFYEEADGSSPRITSIAIRDLKTGQTYSFSIHKTAEIENKLNHIQQHFDYLERKMLDEYFNFIQKHANHHWVHWNMRNANYGFIAIEHRYKVLGGSPTEIDVAYKHDFSRMLIAIYGVSYIGHPRLENLIEKNKISTMDFLTGTEEAEAFSKGDFKKLHQSTLKKTDIIANLMHRTNVGILKTNNRWYEIYGSYVSSIIYLLDKHPIIKLISIAASAIAVFSFMYYVIFNFFA